MKNWVWGRSMRRKNNNKDVVVNSNAAISQRLKPAEKIIFDFLIYEASIFSYYIFQMYKQIAILVLLLVAAAGQTCSATSLNNIASKTLTLAVGTNGFTQKEYVETINGSLGISSTVHVAFAIAGFQASCTQTAYSLGVDTVILENSNTKMRFTMNYALQDGSANPVVTQWTRVKISYLLVSDKFTSYSSGLFANYVWAGSVEITPNKTGNYGLYGPGSLFATADPVDTNCGYLSNAVSTSTARFRRTCVVGDVMVPHYYIMGFQFTPSTATIGAKAQIPNYNTKGDNKVAFGASDAEGYGPVVKLDTYGGSLKKLKVAIVLTTLVQQSSYPNNIQSFGYSGVYMPIDMNNLLRPILYNAPSQTGPNAFNKERYNMARISYGIYGLASFTLNPATGCSAIDLDLEIKDVNNVILRTDNGNSLQDVYVAGDFYSGSSLNVCGAGASSNPSRTMTQIPTKIYKTIPDFTSDGQDIQFTSNDPSTFKVTGKSLDSGSSTITYNITLNYEGFLSGYTYKIDLKLQTTSADPWTTEFANVTNAYIKWTTFMEDKTIYDVNMTSLNGNLVTGVNSKSLGVAIKSTTPVVRFLLVIPRPIFTIKAQTFTADLSIKIQEYTTVYLPNTDCCDAKCPDGSGINLQSSPPNCIVCTGDANLAYDPSTGICTCKVGFYNALDYVGTLSPGGFSCFPCLAKLCSTCAAANVTRCTACVTGAALDSSNVCNCGSGYFETNGTCQTCPAKCNGCQTSGVCSACADPQRKLDQNCDCPAGFYDDGSATCKACNPLCKTCTNSSSCTSCFTENNRSLSNGQCVCSSGFYQIVNTDNTVSCRKCGAECQECSGPNVCVNCDASQNRIIGYDEMGHPTCFCAPGFTSTKNGPCIQNGCTADPYCQVCDDARGVTVCVQCISSTNRVLQLPQYQCVCKEGFYDDKGICKPCASGCAKCSNATACERCAVSATNSNNGSCSCPQSYFFAVEPLRFCKRCKQYCLKCINDNSCDLCLPGFSATSNGECICARGKYVNSNLQCVPCINNCTVCSGETNCSLCAAGLFLQETKCVSRCNLGFFISGVVCEKCQDGCSHCERAGTCLVCEAGRYSYNGLCYVNCPSGAIAEVTNMTCLPCNSPCGNCTQHPSKCLTCLSGNFFDFSCVDSCPVGTYAENKICKYCTFECAACLGSATTCIACPDGQFLFEGKCFAKCPIPLVNGRCPNLCPSGFFTQAGNGNCLKCNDRCKTCENAADKCTSCQSGFASNGACVTACPANTLNLNGNCLPCAEGCNGCKNTVSECATCQSGFFLVGSKCVASCDPGFFRDGNNGCRKCPDTCTSCSSATTCTACVETRNQPVNGVCYTCIYPCTSCTSFEQCTACLTGFSVVNGRCTSQCPAGSTSVNGACQCTNGVFQNGQCVSACPASWTNINGACQQCDSSCAECSGNTTACTSCKSGFLLNGVKGTCEVNRNCQFGEFFSTESNICKRICPVGYSFQDSLCVSECLSGFRDNGFGGCVAQGVVTGCSFPYFFQQGSCVSTCNAGSYPNSATRVCDACSSNCFSCMSSAFCTSCSSGFDLKSNICLTGERCANNKLKYNGVCLDSCPVGTIASNGYCERRCDPNSYFLDNKCYATCPTGFTLRTDVACVSQCPTGFILDGSVCKLSVQTCPSGQFYNAQSGSCVACAYPCTECQFINSYCTACPSGFSLSSNKCAESNSCGSGKFRTASGSCSNCPAKCLDCVSATECATCASGYVFNGADCVLRVANLKEIAITQTALSRRNNTVFVSIKTSIIPNGLSSDQQNGFFIVVASANDKVNKVNQWISTTESNTVIVAVEYASYPVTTSTLFVALNAGLLSTSLANVGYTATENSFLSVVVSNGIAIAPATLNIPASATNSAASEPATLGFKARSNALRVTENAL